ncbi:glycosyltransferase family 2 protein [Flavobacterium taihuense]|uniref:Glycosyltransferase family 2 protein n=1 Tax=Flavobacterium taihuense TaxID=2857508 RepID=A0ABS6XUU2_9FLAO|nr:glycosyltransferase family A protein [Flavobacterium taihuense]MBW4360369.1 glycosyltransferase family 2 protein [Flavobacterium taihuense]
MDNPLISIIIPTFNRVLLIRETLDSILVQGYANWECIIVDDGSTDDTMALVEEYLKKNSQFKYYLRPENRPKGANACRNYGFERSKGEFIMFVDSDDICEPFCLAERMALMTKDWSIDLLIRDTSLLIDGKKQLFSINKDPKNINIENYLRMFLRYEIPWHTMGSCYKRYILENCRFDENLKRFQDVSFNIKVLSRLNQLKISRDYNIDSYYRVDEDKVLKGNFIANMLDSLLVLYEIHVDFFKNKNYASDLRKFSCKIILEYVMPYFYQNKKESNKIFVWSIKSTLYTLKQKRELLLLMFFLNFKLFKIKGIGMNAFRNKFKRIVNE